MLTVAISNYAKEKAREYILGVFRQAKPGSNTNVGSALRSLMVIPFSLVYASVFQDIEVLRELFLGNFSILSESEMDLLAGNLLVTRPQGSRSVGIVRVYPDNIENFTLETFPYFENDLGTEYAPIQQRQYTTADYLDDNGRFYVNVPVVALEPGLDGQSDVDEINKFKNMPIPTNSVTNIAPTQGGTERPTNAEFFEMVRDGINDKTTNQIGSIEQYINENLTSVTDVKIVTSGDTEMIRDEVWTDDDTTPNLDREGKPWTSHTDIGTVNATTYYGGLYSPTGSFTSDMVGKRIAIENDIESFRTILEYIDANTVIVSGYPIESDTITTAEVWEEAMKVSVMADVYMYIPTVQVQSTVVDNRFNLKADGDQNGVLTKIYYEVQENFTYPDGVQGQYFVLREGQSTEVVKDVVSVGVDGTGTYIEIDNSDTLSISNNDIISVYDMEEINIGEDLTYLPSIYILKIEKLDPLSFEVLETIPRGMPGGYNEPGWYEKDTDPAQLFSAREEKTIVIDNKQDDPAFEEFTTANGLFTDSSSKKTGTAAADTSGRDKFRVAGHDWTGQEGREITITREEFELSDTDISGGVVSAGAGTTTLTTDQNIEWMSDVGYRDDVRVTTKNGGATIKTWEPNTVAVYGNQIESLTGASFDGTVDGVDIDLPDNYIGNDPLAATPTPTAQDIAWLIDGTFAQWDGTQWVAVDVDANAPTVEELVLETVIEEIDGDSVYISTSSPIVVKMDSSGVDENTISVATAEDETGDYGYFPIRITYATHNDIPDLQELVDDSRQALLCKDTLIRSMYPSIIDATVRFEGESTEDQLLQRFIELIQTAVGDADGEEVKLSMSNVVAALDEEGLADSIDVNFEVKVTNYLNDGSLQIRYINPSDSTKLKLAWVADTGAGAKVVTLQRVGDTTATPSGRGVLWLGGNNPNIQEGVPYEAVIDNGDDTFDFILRDAWPTAYAHSEWETAYASVRDYSPTLEYTDQEIKIPSTNRPYVRELVVIKNA